MDAAQMDFSPGGLVVLNAILGVVMYGVALDLRVADFQHAVKVPRAFFAGALSQLVLLPALTCGLTLLLRPPPSVALGMMLVAACPGGNVSNFLVHFARGNTALSVTLTAFSTAAAIAATPINLAFWASLNPDTAKLVAQIDLDPLGMLTTVLVILGVPLALGMWTAKRWPEVAAKLRKPMKIGSLVVFAAFVAIALGKNFGLFLTHIGELVGIVALHNGVALALGYGVATVARLPAADRRAIAIETGIQNSGLGLTLIFTFFGGLGGMAMVAGWWGIWHIVAGLTAASLWRRRPPPVPADVV